MAFDFPNFPTPNALDGNRAWTATFDSYDQRNEDAYYVVTLLDHGAEVARFMVQESLAWVGDDWTGPDFVPTLRRDLARLAAAGKTNTSYTGPMAPR